MTQLLVIREYIKNFYTKYEEFIVPLLKFVLGLILFLTINGRMGYMEKIDHVAIVLVAALLCSFLPLGVMVFLSAMFLLLHTYALSAECVVVLLLAYIIVLVIYLRFAPKAHLLLLLTPLLFVWKIPYAAPLAAGLFGTPGSCGCGCRRRSGILCAGIYYRQCAGVWRRGKRYHAAALQRYGNRRDRK